jgi:hypothetical protein
MSFFERCGEKGGEYHMAATKKAAAKKKTAKKTAKKK